MPAPKPRAADFAEKQAWAVFVGHVRTGHTEPSDVRYLREIETVAFGRAAHSRVLRDLDREETPESAHALLLDLGYWAPTVNPYPSRLEAATTQPDLPLPPLPDEPRRDLTHLAAFAIDDATTDMPDDALSYEAGRLWVHVADTAAIVSPDSPLDLEARGRGASLYLPEGAVHMLPPAATPLLALGLSEVSPALSFGLDVTPDGHVIAAEIIPSWVRVHAPDLRRGHGAHRRSAASRSVPAGKRLPGAARRSRRHFHPPAGDRHPGRRRGGDVAVGRVAAQSCAR